MGANTLVAHGGWWKAVLDNVCLEYKGRQIMINLKMSPGDPKRSCSFLFAAKAFQNFFAGFEF